MLCGAISTDESKNSVLCRFMRYYITEKLQNKLNNIINQYNDYIITFGLKGLIITTKDKQYILKYKDL